MSDYIDPEFCRLCREPESLCECDTFCSSYDDAIARLKAQLADREARLVAVKHMLVSDVQSWDDALNWNQRLDALLDGDKPLDLPTALSLAGWEIRATLPGGAAHVVRRKGADDD